MQQQDHAGQASDSAPKRGTGLLGFGTESRTVLTGFAVAVLFTALAFFVLHAKGKALDGIEANGRTIAGVVTNAVELTRSGSKSYQLEYEFKVDGVTYTGIKPVERDEARAAYRGAPLTVTYDAAAPKHNIAVPLEDARQNTRVAGRVAWPFAAVVWGLAFWKLASSRKGM